jgi:GxxExxY protein
MRRWNTDDSNYELQIADCGGGTRMTGLDGLTRILEEIFKHHNMKHEKITEDIIKAYYIVYNTLGYGFLEKVYENALFIELIEMGYKVERQKKVHVHYKGHIVGDYSTDLIVEDCVVCELKAHERLEEESEYQLLNYLRATTIEVGLLLNFGKSPEMKRKVYDNDKKTWSTSRLTKL